MLNYLHQINYLNQKLIFNQINSIYEHLFNNQYAGPTISFLQELFCVTKDS